MGFNKLVRICVGTTFTASTGDLSPMGATGVSRNKLRLGRDTSGPYNRRIRSNLLNSIIGPYEHWSYHTRGTETCL